MHESVLKDFFLGKATAEELKNDLTGTLARTGKQSTQVGIVDMDSEFEVFPEHLIRVCDAVISGTLVPHDLFTVGFCLMASENFEWDGDTEDGERVADTLNEWSAYQINYLLTLETTLKFKERLVSGKDLFTDKDINKNYEL